MDKVNQWAEEIDCLKTIISKTELLETTKWGSSVFTVNGKNVLGVSGFKNYFAIWFFNGVFLKDEQKVLMNAQEGLTKSQRQWRFNSKDDIDESLVLLYVYEAIANEKQGKSIKPEKKILKIPTLLQQALDENATLNESFEKFSQYKKNEFSEYIDLAKREETKQSRLEKILPLILKGIGLNDKYK